MEALQEAVDLDSDAVGNMRLEFTLPDREQALLVEPARLTPSQTGWRLEFTDGSRLLLPDEVPIATRVRIGQATETEMAGTVTPRQDGPFRSGGTFPTWVSAWPAADSRSGLAPYSCHETFAARHGSGVAVDTHL